MGTFLVTGGCGFIGSHLVNALLSLKHHVRVLDNLSTGKGQNLSPAAELLVGDVCDTGVVKNAMNRVDGCFHLAAAVPTRNTPDDWASVRQTNLIGTINIFDAARIARRRRSARVVYASSAAVYGEAQTPVSEDDGTNPITPLGADKLACEQYARVAANAQGVPTLGLRLFSVYGPGQDPDSPSSGVVAIFLNNLRKKEPLQIFGDGLQIRDFVYVADAVKFLIVGMQHRDRRPLIFNVCTGRPTSIKLLSSAVASVLCEQSFVNYAPERHGDIRSCVGDPRKANRALGAVTDVDLYSGLRMCAGRLMA